MQAKLPHIRYCMQDNGVKPFTETRRSTVKDVMSVKE
jgi:hypothetical protein